MAEEERRIGRYVVQEHTAHRLVTKAQGVTPIALGVLWGAFLLVASLIAPWRAGTRLYIAVTAAVCILAVSLLIVRFIPLRKRFTVDVEAGEYRIEHIYLLPSTLRVREIRIPLAAIVGIQCRPRVWRDRPDVEAVRWAVELVGEGEQAWRLDEGAGEEPIREFARLVAEVSGRPLLEAE